MKRDTNMPRRGFLKSTTMAATASLGLAGLPMAGMAYDGPPDDRMNVIGPRSGFSPQIGTLLSMMTWMRGVILRPVKGMPVEQLDFLNDDQSNSIGSMLLHLAATERFYQIHTFDGKNWGDWPEADKQRFGLAMGLGPEARKAIKGHSLDFYLSTLQEVRDYTIAEFKKRDDDWLMRVDEKWPWGPTNNYCKWFHVCEHESNHNGQIKYIKSRLPGAKASRD